MEACQYCGTEFEPEPEGWASFCSTLCAERQSRLEAEEDRRDKLGNLEQVESQDPGDRHYP